jgi:hypothetical protein
MDMRCLDNYFLGLLYIPLFFRCVFPHQVPSACIIKMVFWHDPLVLEKDYCTFPGQFINLILFRPLHTSGCRQARPCCCWYLHVRSLSYTGTHKAILTRKGLSWETMLTADFELDILRGKRPYRWTIWVSFYAAIGYRHLLN